MSLGLGDVFSQTILDESRFKPVWEKMREYAIRGLMLTSLLMISIELTTKPTQCSPRNPSPNNTMTSLQSLFVNDVCYHQQHWALKFAGIFAVSLSTIIYGSFSIWIVFPDVISVFSTVNQFDVELSENHVSPKKVYDAIINPSVGDTSAAASIKSLLEKHKTISVIRKHKTEAAKCADAFSNKTDETRDLVEDSCRKLFITPRCHTISFWYLIRNILSLLSVIGSGTLFAYQVTHYIVAHKFESNSFYCTLSQEEADTAGKKELFCSSDLASRIYPYSIMYLIFISVLLVIGLIALTCGVRIKSKRYAREEMSIGGGTNTTAKVNVLEDGYFIQHYNTFARVLHESTILLLTLDCNEAVLENMYQKYEVAILVGDSAYLALYIELFADGEKNFIKFFENLRNEPQPISDEAQNQQEIIASNENAQNDDLATQETEVSSSSKKKIKPINRPNIMMEVNANRPSPVNKPICDEDQNQQEIIDSNENAKNDDLATQETEDLRSSTKKVRTRSHCSISMTVSETRPPPGNENLDNGNEQGQINKEAHELALNLLSTLENNSRNHNSKLMKCIKELIKMFKPDLKRCSTDQGGGKDNEIKTNEVRNSNAISKSM